MDENPETRAENVASIGDIELVRLRRENAQLKDQLEGLLLRIERNEEIYRQFYRLQTRFIAARDLTSLVWTATHDLEEAFTLSRVTVTLSSEGVGALFFSTKPAPSIRDRILLIDDADLTATFNERMRPLIRIGQEGVNRVLFFGEHSPNVRSEALVPLYLHGRLGGSLNLGAAAPTRFLPSYSTDLLQHLATIFALCLENLLHHAPLPAEP